MNVMTIVILAIIALFAFNGYRKGLVRKASGVIALLISSVLVSVLLPAVTKVIQEKTPVYEFLAAQCESTVSSMSAKAVSSQTVEDAVMRSGGSFGREEIRSLMDQYGLDGSRIDAMSDEQLEEFVNTDLKDYLEQIGVGGLLGEGTAGIESSMRALASLTKNEQTRLIKNLPVPEFLKRLILTYNNTQGYQRLGAEDFGDYLARFIASVILNILAFIATLAVVHLIVWGLLSAFDMVAHFPLLSTVNHAGGLIVGLIQGLLVVWMIFLVVSLLSGTQIGITMMKMIDESVLLRPMYQSNLFMKIVASAISRIIG